MEEGILTSTQKFMIFLRTQWSIVANLFKACSISLDLQAANPNFDAKLTKAHADLDRTISLTISTFTDIISKVGEYRDLSQEAFAFLEDDLNRSVNVSVQIAEEMINGYSEEFKGKTTVLENKLEEIKEKVERHLKKQMEAE